MPAIIPIIAGVGALASAASGVAGAVKGAGGGGGGPQPNNIGAGGMPPGGLPPPPPVNDLPGTVPAAPNSDPLQQIPHMAGGGVGGWGQNQRSGYGPNSGYNGGDTPQAVGGPSNPGGQGSAPPAQGSGGDPYGGTINPYTLAGNGYQMFNPGQAPTLNSYFNGYGAAQVGNGQTAQDRSGEMSLADALRQQSMGQGPSVAQEQLRQGTNQTLANSMGILASSRNSPGGLAQALQANASAGQQSAAQSAALRAQEQQSGQQGLASELGTIGNQDINMATTNANATNQARQFNAQDQAALANLLQNQYQYNTGIGQHELDQRNQYVAQGMGADISNGQNQANYWRNNGTQAAGNLVNAGSGWLAQGGGGNNNNGGGNGGGGDQGGAGGSGDFSNNYNANFQYATGAAVTKGPTVALIGEKGPEAVVPITPDGSPDMTRAKNPALMALLRHPDFIAAVRDQAQQAIGEGSITDRDKMLKDYLANKGAPGGYAGRS